MYQTILTLPDGTELSSGAGHSIAIQSVQYTEAVNSGDELTLGSACACCLEVSIYAPAGSLSIQAGDDVVCWTLDDDGYREQLGVFTAEKPTRSSANGYRLTAYDHVAKLDKDLTAWLAAEKAAEDAAPGRWTYTLAAFAAAVCGQCGLTFAGGVPEAVADFAIAPFALESCTGRQLMQWVGEAAGRFCRATPDGKIELAWYEDLEPELDADIGPAEQQHVRLRLAGSTLRTNAQQIYRVGRGRIWYYQNSLSYEDFRVAPIRKVQIRQQEDDLGVVWPDGITESVNTYVVQANPLLASDSQERLQPVARHLYSVCSAIQYTPCTLTIPAVNGLHAGGIIPITDKNGSTITAYIMRRTRTGGKDKLECTGSCSRQSTTACNTKFLKDVTGKMLILQTSIDGLVLQNATLAGDYTELKQTTESLSLTVVKKGDVRSQFAMEDDSISITSGKLTFAAASIEIASDHFDLKDGVITSKASYNTKAGAEEWAAQLSAGQLVMGIRQPDGSIDPRVNLFHAGNYDAGYFELIGNYDSYSSQFMFSSDGLAFNRCAFSPFQYGSHTTIFRLTPEGRVIMQAADTDTPATVEIGGGVVTANAVVSPGGFFVTGSNARTNALYVRQPGTASLVYGCVNASTVLANPGSYSVLAAAAI